MHAVIVLKLVIYGTQNASLDFQCPCLPILVSARHFDIAPDTLASANIYALNIPSRRGGPGRSRGAAPRPAGTCNFITRDDLLHCTPSARWELSRAKILMFDSSELIVLLAEARVAADCRLGALSATLRRKLQII
ncbi:hypothetical protein EVAR_41738_1 [Eumeta japonica]|uniref:Uncharacterized protein n=1 Tax=Eumeta variegata TaxID=151549 RepID=A0A4C1W007_EUMVA|nr:hypothetical protein EVAR_41738_1 [Eumeta japonica]